MRRRSLMKLAGGIATGSFAVSTGALGRERSPEVGDFVPYADHEHPEYDDDFEEREWGYVLTDFAPPSGTENPVVFAMRGYEGASATSRPTHYVRMRDDALIALNMNDENPALEPYISPRASIRGTACSGGLFNLWDRTQAMDGYELIEWLADRPWSLDRIGLFGSSYGGLMAYPIASTQPPSLAAMMANKVIGDYYRGFARPGGVPQSLWTRIWTQQVRPAGSAAGKESAVEAGDEICAQIGGGAGDYEVNVGEIMLEEEQDTLDYSARSIIPYADEITVPVFTSHAWQDELTGPRGGPAIFDALSPEPVEPSDFPGRRPPRGELREEPKMLRTTNGGHATATIGERDAQRWFDYWLLGEDTGIQDEQRVKHYFGTRTTEQGFPTTGCISQDYFPAPDTTWERFYLRDDNGLSTDPPQGSGGSDSYRNTIFQDWFVSGGLTERDGLVAYQSEPMEEARIIAGPIAATLFIETTETPEDPTDMDFWVSIADIYPDDQHITYLQKGMLRASHRALDEYHTRYNDDGEIIWPYHPHTNPTAIHTDTVYRYEIEVFPLAHVLYPGHRLAVNIHAPPETDFTYLDTGWGWGYDARDTDGENVVHRTEEHPSSVLLPFLDVPKGDSLPGEPECGVPDGYNCVDISL